MEPSEDQLKMAFEYLDEQLKTTFKKVIRVRIDEDTTHRGEKEYRLLSYQLSFPERKLTIQAQDPKQKNMIYWLRYDNIFDIEFSETDLWVKVVVFCREDGGGVLSPEKAISRNEQVVSINAGLDFRRRRLTGSTIAE